MIDTRRGKAHDGIHDKFYIKFMLSHNFTERHEARKTSKGRGDLIFLCNYRALSKR